MKKKVVKFSVDFFFLDRQQICEILAKIFFMILVQSEIYLTEKTSQNDSSNTSGVNQAGVNDFANISRGELTRKIDFTPEAKEGKTITLSALPHCPFHRFVRTFS